MKLDEIELQFEVDWRGHEGHILVKCNDLELDEKSITRAIYRVSFPLNGSRWLARNIINNSTYSL